MTQSKDLRLGCNKCRDVINDVILSGRSEPKDLRLTKPAKRPPKSDVILSGVIAKL
jgi:hypothetical protein